MKEARAFEGDAGARGRSLSNDICTVDQGLKKWLEICEKEGKDGGDPVTKGTVQNYEYRAGIIRSYNWTKPLHELKPPDIVEFRSWLLLNYSRSVAHKALTSLHSMARELVIRGMLSQNFVAGITIQSNSRYDQPVTIPTEADVRALLSAADDLANSKNETIKNAWVRYRPMLYLAADSGMRPQEYIVVAKSNLKDKGVQVERALERLGEISVTKTPAGRRFIDLSPHTLDLVKHYADHHAVDNKYDLVFPAQTGKWLSHKNWLRRGFYVACFKANLVEEVEEEGEIVTRPKFRPYDLRHFYASMLIDQNVNLKRVQYLMGHENIETTLNVYAHLIERADAKTQARTGLLSSMQTPSCGKSVAADT